MAPFRGWAELPPELLCRIGDSLDLKCYAGARGACTAWRLALAPPFPSLLVVPDDATFSPSASSIPARRSFWLKPIPSGAHCVGSSNGWLALSVGRGMFSLFNPVTAAEIPLPPLIYDSRWVSKTKLVFTPNPARNDFVAVAICDISRLAYVTAGARRWAILDPVGLADGDQFADIVYHDQNERGARVYCLTSCGAVHVLRLPERLRREPIAADDPSSLPPIPARLLSAATPTCIARWRTQQQNARIHIRSLGPDLNPPAEVEPLMSLPFSFTPPYNTVSGYTSAKNLVFCEGNMYQIWRNMSCTITVRLPGGGRFRVEENAVFVLRYYPRRRQRCWDAVTDMGGCSVFVGRNNAVSMSRVEGVPGLKGNCVYCIGGTGRDKGMVFDMATGRSTASLVPAAAGIVPESTICWYFSATY